MERWKCTWSSSCPCTGIWVRGGGGGTYKKEGLRLVQLDLQIARAKPLNNNLCIALLMSCEWVLSVLRGLSTHAPPPPAPQCKQASKECSLTNTQEPYILPKTSRSSPPPTRGAAALKKIPSTKGLLKGDPQDWWFSFGSRKSRPFAPATLCNFEHGRTNDTNVGPPAGEGK